MSSTILPVPVPLFAARVAPLRRRRRGRDGATPERAAIVLQLACLQQPPDAAEDGLVSAHTCLAEQPHEIEVARPSVIFARPDGRSPWCSVPSMPTNAAG